MRPPFDVIPDIPEEGAPEGATELGLWLGEPPMSIPGMSGLIGVGEEAGGATAEGDGEAAGEHAATATESVTSAAIAVWRFCTARGPFLRKKSPDHGVPS
ncbi:MAG: hypothetical protein HY262_02590 [Chloroflexi bacterium]|nr:hypothetical protein [Chloroflexota bacterium]